MDLGMYIELVLELLGIPDLSVDLIWTLRTF